MADVGLRDLGSFVPGRRVRDVSREASPPPPPTAVARVEPKVAEPPAVIAMPPPPPPAPSKASKHSFASDRCEGPDLLGIDATLIHLAELAAHKSTTGPLSIGMIGGPGSGKSFAMRRLTGHMRALAKAASQTTGPFVSRVHVETIDAASLDGAPDLALIARLHFGLARAHPEVANEIGDAARDPHATLRAAEEKLDESRRRLDVERRALDEAGSRRARLTENVLYEASGSQIDAYARSHRASIESRLHSFGIFGDPIRNYKDLVQLSAGSGSKIGLALRALYAYKGQLKLLITALVLVAIGFGLGMAIDAQAFWLESMRGGPKAGASAADWIQAHVGLLATAKSAAYILAMVAVIANGARALGFLRPIFKGTRLLDGDLDSRRRDLDSLFAHQTKRVDTFEAAVDRFTREVTEAERRMGSAHGVRREPSPFEPAGKPATAQEAFAALSTVLADGRPDTPQRIVLALDHIDATSPERARAILDALHRAAVPGLVTIVAADPARLDPDGARRDEIERWIDVPFRLDASVSAEARLAFLKEALDQASPGVVPARLDAARTELDADVSDEEASLLAALADLAGGTPRAIKRFANLYRLARLGEERPLGPLAFMLAVMLGGTAAERQAAFDATAGDPSGRYDLSVGALRLQAALNAAVAIGGRFTRVEANEAARRAASFAI